MTVETYNFIHLDLQQRGFPAYPPYYKILKAKQNCYPECVHITEREAVVPLQSLLQHTFDRIVQLQDEVFSQYCNKIGTNILDCVFEGVWGFDGSSGQALYKQAFEDQGENESSIFATTFVPLRIYHQSTQNDKVLLWTNIAAQSYRSCRPLRIIYKKESKELILSEKDRVNQEIDHLTPFYYKLPSGQQINATCNLYLAAIDGKVLNTILDTPSQMRCPYCALTATQFNNLEIVFSKTVDSDTLTHGINPLHAWIRVLEFLLKLGYKCEVKKWRIKQSSQEGLAVQERKKRIQNAIRDKIGVLVDVVLPNSGTTNDGNTSRTVLADENRKTFADILGLELWLLDGLYIILIVISCGIPVDADKFGAFCKDLAYKYVSVYDWHPMTVSIHKILIHGASIIDKTPLPIGMLSEQAAESRNKYWRSDREHHTQI